jgi:hypothetical protein
MVGLPASGETADARWPLARSTSGKAKVMTTCRLILAAMLVAESLVSHASSAALEGRVYLDANHNGRLDPGEPGVANVLVNRDIP